MGIHYLPLEVFKLVFVWSEWNGRQHDKGLLQQQRSTFGARMKIMWKEQLVDPPID